MASFRRSQSPANQAELDPFFSIPSPSYKPNSSKSWYSSLLTLFIGSFNRYPKKGNPHLSKRSFNRYLLCFALGFFIGLIPFGYFLLDDVNPQDFSFDRDLTTVVVTRDRNSNVIVDAVTLLAKLPEKPTKFKQLIVVTPTYNRALQAYFLNRLSQALSLVPPPLLWIVVEMNSASVETSRLLRRSRVMYRHLVSSKNSTHVKDRGVHQRNTALHHIQHHRLDGIVYFADDDNVYSLELFESLREVSRFGTWPVAMLAPSKNKAILEGPVCNGTQVIGWHTNEKSKRLRRFHVDMSGFAFNSTILWDSKRWHRPTSDPIRQRDTVKEGFQETTFIEQVVEDESQMEAVAYNCLKVMNWHLHLEAHNFAYPRGWQLQKNLDVVVPLH